MSELPVGALIPSFAGAPEGAALRLEAGYRVQLLLHRPTPRETAAVQAGPMEFVFDVQGPAMLVLFRSVPVLPWSLALLPWWMRKEPLALSAPFVGRVARFVELALIDTSVGRIVALRALEATEPLLQSAAVLERQAEAAGRDRRAWEEALSWAYEAEGVELGKRAARASVSLRVAGKG